MNYERISFRTSPEQRAFLERISQRYRCRTITGLMRKFLDEVMSKEAVLLESKSVIQEEAQSNATPIPIEPNSKTDNRLVLKDTRIEAVAPIQYLPETRKVMNRTENPYFLYLQDIFWLEEARQKLEGLLGLAK